MQRNGWIPVIAWLLSCASCGTWPSFAGEPTAAVDGPQPRSAEPDSGRSQVESYLAKHCRGCHGPTRPKGGLDLLTLPGDAEIWSRRRVWERVREYVEGGIMPPEDRPQPTDEESSRLTAWIKAVLERDNCGRPGNPGRVTIRRSNRAEYNNTIRDLVGLDYRPAEDFPFDDVGYGFDNIGDVLSLPPILMEKYLAAAGTISERAIVRPSDRRPTDPLPDSHRRILFREPSSPGEYPDVARAILERFAMRAYRRPVAPGEIARLLRLVNLALANGDSFERRIQLAVQAVLVSPHFLFRVELDARPRATGQPAALRRPDGADRRIRAGVAPLVFSLEHHARRGVVSTGGRGEASCAGGPLGPGPPHAAGPESPSDGRKLRRAMVADPEPEGGASRSRSVPRLR